MKTLYRMTIGELELGRAYLDEAMNSFIRGTIKNPWRVMLQRDAWQGDNMVSPASMEAFDYFGVLSNLRRDVEWMLKERTREISDAS